MKPKFLLFTFCLAFFVQFASAQYVEIPDSNFRDILLKKYPTCFDNTKRLDTTCSFVTTDTVLIVSNKGISNLNGIQYFDGLKKLSCENNALTTLPTLPLTLKTLICNDNQISNLPNLPPQLDYLDCNFNKLTSLPNLPSTLKRLDCSFNKLQIIPSLPNNLFALTCGDNKLTTLPILPIKLIELDCSDNFLLNLPSLPNILEFLNCSHNQITILSVLPDSLKTLWCSNNLISKLPELTKNLLNLDCSDNELTDLLSLPKNLIVLSCSNNKLTSIPELPVNLGYLKCDANSNLHCLPFLPNGLSDLYFDVKNIPCMPNKPLGIPSFYASHPICNSSNNLKQCQAFPHVIGTLFIDANKDGVYNNGETRVPNLSVRLSNGSNTFVFSSSKGEFGLTVDTLGEYIINPESLEHFLPTPTSKKITFTHFGQEIVQDFAFQATTPIENTSTNVIPINTARPGFPLSFDVITTNKGTVNSNANVSFNYPNDFTIDSISGGGKISSKGTIFWNYPVFAPFQNQKARVFGHISIKTPIGTSLKFHSSINPNSTSDVDLSNNSDSTTVVIRGSYDPNDKEATPFISPSQVANGGYIDYTIRFQNTGTDTAFTVVVVDTLPTDLLANSLEMMSTSHNCRTTVKGSIVSFEFFSINLLWSSFNEPASHGYIRFKVKPKSTLGLGDVIKNKASIYFDYNAPIVTNIAQTTVGTLIVTETNENATYKSRSPFIYPNPANNFVMLSENGKIEVYSIDGTLILEKQVQQNETLDISTLTKGIYQLKLTTDSNSWSVKLMKD